jgi:hypothetical protein
MTKKIVTIVQSSSNEITFGGQPSRGHRSLFLSTIVFLKDSQDSFKKAASDRGTLRVYCRPSGCSNISLEESLPLTTRANVCLCVIPAAAEATVS